MPPAAAQRPFPPRGKTTSNKGAPVRNPTFGPVFRQAVMPVQAHLPQTLIKSRGRVQSRAGTWAGTRLFNTFEGGTSGVTVRAANPNSPAGNAWDVIDAGAGATIAYDSTRSAHGGLSCKMATVAAADFVLTWSASLVSTATIFFRFYAYFTANPGTAFNLFSAGTAGGIAQCGAIAVNTSGNLIAKNAAGATIFTTISTIPLNQWFRVEGFITGSATAGQVQLSLYTQMDSAAPAETFTSAATQNTTGQVTKASFGALATASIGPFWIDDVGVSDTGLLGPAVTFGPGGSASVACGSAVILPGTGATALFTVPPSLCAVTFYNLSGTLAWVGTSTAVTSGNGIQCHSIPTSFTAFVGSGGATFYGTTGSTVATSVATVQYLIVTDR